MKRPSRPKKQKASEFARALREKGSVDFPVMSGGLIQSIWKAFHTKHERGK